MLGRKISHFGVYGYEEFSKGEIVRLQDEYGKSDNFFAGSIGLKINKLLSEIKKFDFFQEIPRCGVRSKLSHFRAPKNRFVFWMARSPR